LEKLLLRTLGEDVELRTQLAERLPTVKADRAQIEQVLLNLALNARDAMPSGGTLTIVTRGPDRGGHTSSATGRPVSLRVALGTQWSLRG
ncbi:MAG: histidine phosphotransferase family protein, partial [Gemmatimonadota bacterium]|nr:histidine phosphotransferase family protein [Gemmatimonadota bacterium]